MTAGGAPPLLNAPASGVLVAGANPGAIIDGVATPRAPRGCVTRKSLATAVEGASPNPDAGASPGAGAPILVDTPPTRMALPVAPADAVFSADRSNTSARFSDGCST